MNVHVYSRPLACSRLALILTGTSLPSLRVILDSSANLPFLHSSLHTFPQLSPANDPSRSETDKDFNSSGEYPVRSQADLLTLKKRPRASTQKTGVATWSIVNCV